MLSDLIARAKRHGADAADAVLVESASLSASRRMGVPEDLERSESATLALRVFTEGRLASVSSTDMRPALFDTLAERAVSMAKASPPDPFSTLAPAELLAKTLPPLDVFDADEPSAAWLQEQCALAEDAALAVKGVTNSEGAGAGFGKYTFSLATSHGFAQSHASSSFSVSVTALAGTGTGMERDYDYATVRHRGDLPQPQTIGASAGALAGARLNPRKMPTKPVPVVFDPRAAKLLLGSLAGAISGSSVARGVSFLKGAMGTKLFHESVSILDDPHIKRGLASRPFDGEGVACAKMALIENGVLRHWLLDTRSANQLKLTTTGHAARGAGAPSPGASNLYMAAGALTPAQLMADIDEGFYVTETFGMGVNLVTGDYSQGAAGFWISKGEKTFAVSEMTIAGKLTDMFKNLIPANDLAFRYAHNAPTVRVDGMMVAGT